MSKKNIYELFVVDSNGLKLTRNEVNRIRTLGTNLVRYYCFICYLITMMYLTIKQLVILSI